MRKCERPQTRSCALGIGIISLNLGSSFRGSRCNIKPGADSRIRGEGCGLECCDGGFRAGVLRRGTGRESQSWWHKLSSPALHCYTKRREGGRGGEELPRRLSQAVRVERKVVDSKYL